MIFYQMHWSISKVPELDWNYFNNQVTAIREAGAPRHHGAPIKGISETSRNITVIWYRGVQEGGGLQLDPDYTKTGIR